MSAQRTSSTLLWGSRLCPPLALTIIILLHCDVVSMGLQRWNIWVADSWSWAAVSCVVGFALGVVGLALEKAAGRAENRAAHVANAVLVGAAVSSVILTGVAAVFSYLLAMGVG